MRSTPLAALAPVVPLVLALALVLVPGLAAPASAGTVRFVESFDDGMNEGGWTGGFVFDAFGFGVREEIEDGGGSKGGGPFLFRFAEEFIPEVHTTAGVPSIFHGDWSELGVRAFSADVKVFQYSDFLDEDHPLMAGPQPLFTRERHVTLMLTRDPDPSRPFNECTVVNVGGHHLTSGGPAGGTPFVPSSRHGDRGLTPQHVNGEPRGEGWETFHFTVRARSERLPAGWAVPGFDTDVNRDGDPDLFDNACPLEDDLAWRYVIEDVTQVTFRLADPIGEALGIGQFFAYGIDEITLSLQD